MNAFLSLILLCGAVGLVGCTQSTRYEQRAIELPANDRKTSPDMAIHIREELIARGLLADIQKQFPHLTKQQLSGIYLTWKSGEHEGKTGVFLLTGIRYTGSLPKAKEIADYCESRVKQALAEKFSTP